MKNKLFQYIYSCYMLWKMGFYITENVNIGKSYDGKDKKYGFLRLHFINGKFENHCVADFDFCIRDGKTIFVDMKADNENLAKTTFRYDAPKNK